MSSTPCYSRFNLPVNAVEWDCSATADTRKTLQTGGVCPVRPEKSPCFSHILDNNNTHLTRFGGIFRPCQLQCWLTVICVFQGKHLIVLWAVTIAFFSEFPHQLIPICPRSDAVTMGWIHGPSSCERAEWTNLPYTHLVSGLNESVLIIYSLEVNVWQIEQ